MDKETTIRLYHDVLNVFDRYGCDRTKVMATCWHILERLYTEWLIDNPKGRELIVFELDLHKDMVLQTMLGKKWSGESDIPDKIPFK